MGLGGELGQAERKPLTYIGEVFGILAEELGENGLPLEPFFILKDVAVHEAIHHGGVGVDVNIKLQACFLLRERITNEKSGVTELYLEGTRQSTCYTYTHVGAHTAHIQFSFKLSLCVSQFSSHWQCPWRC